MNEPKRQLVYVVLHADYGDQGVDFKGVFNTGEAAERFVAEAQPNEHERQWWYIKKTEVRE